MRTLHARLRQGATEHASAIAAALALGLALACKFAYAHATAADLRWVLGPSCSVAQALGGLHFSWDPAAGFVSDGARMVVGPPCAGVNFMVACALALHFCTQASFASLRGKLAVCSMSFAVAYAATLAANGSRIALAANFGHSDVHAGLVSHASMHRLIGVLVYAIALLGLCSLAARRFAPGRAARTPQLAVPIACYLGVAIALPLVHHALGHRTPGLAEHALQTISAFGLVVASILLGDHLLDRLFSGRARDRARS